METPIVASSCCGRVRTTLEGGRLTAVGFDRAWAAAADDAALERSVEDGLQAGLDALFKHVQPNRGVVERVDDLARRALATCWESAPVKEASPLPTVDGQSWPEHVAQVLVALDASNLPWRLVAAGHLQRRPTLSGVSGFPFGVLLRQQCGGRLPRDAAADDRWPVARRRSHLHRRRHWHPGWEGHPDKKDAAAAPSDGNITDQRTAGPQQRATSSADRSGATDSPAISELSESLRTGLERCSQHVQAVVRGVDSVLVRVPGATDGVRGSQLADLCLRFDRARIASTGVLATPGDPDALREAALAVVTSARRAGQHAGRHCLDDHSEGRPVSEDGVSIPHAQAVAAMVVKSVGNDLGAALVGFSDAVTVFWAALVATISAGPDPADGGRRPRRQSVRSSVPGSGPGHHRRPETLQLHHRHRPDARHGRHCRWKSNRRASPATRRPHRASSRPIGRPKPRTYGGVACGRTGADRSTAVGRRFATARWCLTVVRPASSPRKDVRVVADPDGRPEHPHTT